MSMEPADYQKCLVLFVDDEEKTRKYFKRLFGDTFRIVLAGDGIEALEVLKSNLDEIGLIVTDQRMPNETGTAFLEKAVKLKPSLVRILSTAYADIEAAIDSVNKGGVYRYITKPWDVADFEVTLKRAVEFYLLQEERDQLLTQKLTGIESLAVADRILSLAALAAARESRLEHVSEGLSTLVQLHGAASPTGSAAHAHRASWSELHHRHRAFLGKAIALLPAGLASSPRLQAGDVVPAAKVIHGDEQFIVEAAAGEGAKWPGPLEQTTDLVQSLINALRAILGPTDKVQIFDKAQGVELLLPNGPLAQALEPLFGSTDGAPGEACFGLVAAFLRFAHVGGTFEILPQAGTQTVKLRVGFAASHLAGVEGDSIESVASDLIGNELFWSRNLG